jgi:hypothetical protein
MGVMQLGLGLGLTRDVWGRCATGTRCVQGRSAGSVQRIAQGAGILDTALENFCRASQLVEPSTADPHGRWYGVGFRKFRLPD